VVSAWKVGANSVKTLKFENGGGCTTPPPSSMVVPHLNRLIINYCYHNLYKSIFFVMLTFVSFLGVDRKKWGDGSWREAAGGG